MRGKLLLHNYLPWVNATGCVHNRFFFYGFGIMHIHFPGMLFGVHGCVGGKNTVTVLLVNFEFNRIFFPAVM